MTKYNRDDIKVMDISLAMVSEIEGMVYYMDHKPEGLEDLLTQVNDLLMKESMEPFEDEEGEQE